MNQKPTSQAPAQDQLNLISDKLYWHGYWEAYRERIFSKIRLPPRILEFGVLYGASIRALRNEFPYAEIIGVDTSAQESSWPQDGNIKYFQIDQGNIPSLNSMLRQFSGGFDLIIDDGSHRPDDQYTCMMECLPFVKQSGFYVIEDVQTSYETCAHKTNVFQVLMAIEHLKRTGVELTDRVLWNLSGSGSRHSFFWKRDIEMLYETLSGVYFYRRITLPCSCFSCGSTEFNYAALTCTCGVDLYRNPDSMAFILRKK